MEYYADLNSRIRRLFFCKNIKEKTSTSRIYTAKIPLVALESEKESEQIIEKRKKNKEQCISWDEYNAQKTQSE